jgi:hypothetical protein
VSLSETQLATQEQTKETAGLVTDICRNPDFEASTGVETHIVIFSAAVGQVRAATFFNPFESNEPVDCNVTTREQIEVSEFSQFILESDFSFFASGLLRTRYTATARRHYATLDHDSELLVPFSRRTDIPFGTPRASRKRLEMKQKEIDSFTKKMLPPEFLQSDYEKLLMALGEFSLKTVVLSGEDASKYNKSSATRW